MTTSVYKNRPGQINWDAYRSTPGGAIMVTPELEQQLQSTNAGIEAETASKIRNQRRLETIFKTAALGIPAAGLGMAAAGAGSVPSFGIGAANTGAWTGAAGAMPSVTTAAAGIGTGAKVGATSGVMSRLGKIFSSPGFETAANTGLALLGMRQSNKANDQARQDALANQAKMIELEQARLAAELQNANLDREDARALNAAIQELEKKKFALAQESAQFERGIIEKNQGVKDRYNANISEPAAMRIRSILGLG